MLRNKTTAPKFVLANEAGAMKDLEALRGTSPFLLLFSRFAGCPTTRRDLLAYGDVCERIRALGADMAVVTADTLENHLRLKMQLQLPFPILSDPDFAVSDLYGVYRSDETDHGPQPHGEPAVFVLDKDGEIAYSQVCTGPKGVANPFELALMILYMTQNNGKYW